MSKHTCIRCGDRYRRGLRFGVCDLFPSYHNSKIYCSSCEEELEYHRAETEYRKKRAERNQRIAEHDRDDTEEQGKWIEQWTDDTTIPEKVRLHIINKTKDFSMIIPVRVQGTMSQIATKSTGKKSSAENRIQEKQEKREKSKKQR